MSTFAERQQPTAPNHTATSPEQEASCHLQPVDFHQEQPRQSRERRRLPVIVVFHSSRRARDDQSEPPSREASRAGRTASENLRNGAFKDETRKSPQMAPEARKANSLAHAELARRADSIVITFNHRIGLLGFLPYSDAEDQLPSAGSGPGHTRSNHALWDQIGLLHWIKHNAAHFGGDQSNVSLLAGDAAAVSSLQLLAMSPLAKGLFKRVVLIHDAPEEDSPNKPPSPDQHFARLFDLAQRSRHLRRKLVSELGLILERDEQLSDFVSNRSRAEPQDNLQIDRRVSKFLKSAKLEQLAKVELELSKVGVAQQQLKPSTAPSKLAAQTTKLVDMIQEPNLDDKLLFPYFSHLVKTNETLAFLSEPKVGFWPSLAASLDQFGENSTATLQAVQLEADYCMYMQQLYAQMFARKPDSELDSVPFASLLKKIDPYKLLPRVSDYQPLLVAANSMKPDSGVEGRLEPERTTDKQSAGKHFVKWRQRNQTANALEFYHLRQAHSLQQLLVQKLHDPQTGGSPSSSFESRPKASDEEDEDEEEYLVTRLQRQQQRSIMVMQQQQSGYESGFSRNKRDSSDGLAIVLSQQLVELLGSFDLLIALRGEPLEWRTSAGESAGDGLDLVRLATLRSNKTLKADFVSFLQMADLHRLAVLKSAPKHLQNLCDFASGQKATWSNPALWWRELKFQAPHSSHVLALGQSTRNRTRSLDLGDLPERDVHSDGRPAAMMSSLLSVGSIKADNETSGSAFARPYDTLNHNVDWTAASPNNERSLIEDLVRLRLDLEPYLGRLSSATKRYQIPAGSEKESSLAEYPQLLPPDDLSNCLNDLGDILERDNQVQPDRPVQFESLNLVRFAEEATCLANTTNKLRYQLRTDAAVDLEPLIRQYFLLNEQRQRKQQMLADESRNGQGALAAPENQQLAEAASNQKRVSSMTTRNLVNHSEGLYLDQLSPSSGGPVDHAGQQLDSLQRLNLTQTVPLKTGPATANGSGNVIRSFFAKTYKDAVGQALAIVVGTGLLIFLLNLAIVLVIAIRSRRNLRSSRRSVQDSSSALDTTGNQQSLGASRPEVAENVEPVKACHQHLCDQRQVMQQQLSCTIDMRRPQACSISSFKNYTSGSEVAANQQQQPNRINKSIKFDLSGAPPAGPVNSKAAKVGSTTGQKSIMKQPATTSDEDELQAVETLAADENLAGHQHLACLNYAQANRLYNDSTSPFANSGLSPVSLDVLDLIPLGCYDAHELAEMSAANVPDDWLGNLKLLSDAQDCHHHIQQLPKLEHSHYKQSLGSSSLTSPFASQSTHSITSVSNNNCLAPLNASEFSPGTNQATQQQVALYSMTGNRVMNSPTSSASLSGMRTPVLHSHPPFGFGDQIVLSNQGSAMHSTNTDQNQVPMSGQMITLICGNENLYDQGQAFDLTVENQVRPNQQNKRQQHLKH